MPPFSLCSDFVEIYSEQEGEFLDLNAFESQEKLDDNEVPDIRFDPVVVLGWDVDDELVRSEAVSESVNGLEGCSSAENSVFIKNRENALKRRIGNGQNVLVCQNDAGFLGFLLVFNQKELH